MGGAGVSVAAPAAVARPRRRSRVGLGAAAWLPPSALHWRVLPVNDAGRAGQLAAAVGAAGWRRCGEVVGWACPAPCTGARPHSQGPADEGPRRWRGGDHGGCDGVEQRDIGLRRCAPVGPARSARSSPPGTGGLRAGAQHWGGGTLDRGNPRRGHWGGRGKPQRNGQRLLLERQRLLAARPRHSECAAPRACAAFAGDTGCVWLGVLCRNPSMVGAVVIATAEPKNTQNQNPTKRRLARLRRPAPISWCAGQGEPRWRAPDSARALAATGSSRPLAGERAGPRRAPQKTTVESMVPMHRAMVSPMSECDVASRSLRASTLPALRTAACSSVSAASSTLTSSA